MALCGSGNFAGPLPNGVAFFTEAELSFLDGPSKLDVGIVDLGGTGNFAGPLPNGVAFFTDDALSFLGGPSKLEVGILDFGGSGNFVAPFPNGVVFLTDASLSFFAGPSKLEVGIVDLGGTGNFVEPPPGDALLAVSPPAVLDGPVKFARSPTDSFTLSPLLDGILLDGIPNLGRLVCSSSVSAGISVCARV